MELATLHTWLADSTIQLIGLKGAGGFGKSALADTVRQRYSDCDRTLAVSFSQPYSFGRWGRWFLAHFDVAVDDRTGNKDLADVVIKSLVDGRHLLILDNLETLLTPDGSWRDEGYKLFLLGWLETQGKSTVLVTSREEPKVPANARPYCRWQRLDGLERSDGIRLLRQLGILGDESALEDLVDKAAGHPLLLKLAAGWVWDDDDDEPYVENLTNVGGVNLFDILGLHRGDPETSIATLLEATLERLPELWRNVLHYCSVYRRPFGLAAAQVMVDEPLDDRQLRQLMKRSLLQAKKETIDGRRCWQYQYQPLIQRYLNHGENDHGHQRAVQFYLSQLPSGLGPETQLVDTVAHQELFYHLCRLGRRLEALNVLWREMDEAERYSSLDVVLQLRGHDQVRYELYELALTGWEPTDEEKERYADVLKNYGDVLQFLDRRDEALENYHQAIEIYRNVGDRLGEANTLKAIGDVLQFLDRRDEALENYHQAIEIYRNVGDRLGEANTLKAIGDVLQFLDRRDEALENYHQAIEIYRNVGARLGEANTLQAIGDVLQFLDRRDEALENYHQAIEIYRNVGARLGEANTLQAIGYVLQFLDRRDEALENYHQAIEIYRNVGARLGEANTLKAIGDVLQFLKRNDEALENYHQAIEIYRNVGDRLGEANTLQAIGDVLQFLKRNDEALENYHQAIEIYRNVGARLGEANTLNVMANTYRALDDIEQMISLNHQARDLHRAIGNSQGEANCLGNLGITYLKQEDFSNALEMFTSCLNIFQTTGDKFSQALSYTYIGYSFSALEDYQQAKTAHQEAKTIYLSIGLERNAEVCQDAIDQLIENE